MSGEPLVEVVLEEPGWAVALPEIEAVAETAVTLALEAAGREPGAWQVAVLAGSSERIAGLNARFRGRDAATDVLSFPAFSALPEAPAPRTPLGDIAIGLEVVRSDAEARGVPLKEHTLHLILHGCLHLLGFDHETEHDAREMEGMETASLARVGIQDPYGEGVPDDRRPKE